MFPGLHYRSLGDKEDDGVAGTGDCAHTHEKH